MLTTAAWALLVSITSVASPGYDAAYAQELNNAPPAGSSYRGVSTERPIPAIDTNAETDCTDVWGEEIVQQAISVYDPDEGYIEYGTGHQCETSIKFDYVVAWDYPFGPGDGQALYDDLVSPGAAIYRYTLTYNYDDTTWEWWKESVLIGSVENSAIGLNWGDRVEAGLQSFVSAATVPAHYYDRLKEKLVDGWSDWEARDNEVIDPRPICGEWTSDVKWRVYTISGSGACPAP